MKGIMFLLLAALLVAPGYISAADRKAPPESQAPVASTVTSQKLDINRASTDELIGVPGIGPRMAQAIVDLRLKKGSFAKLEELLEVPGIKEKTLASISAYLTVTPLQSQASQISGTASR